MKYYIGIDPGMSGGIACLDENGNMKFLNVMPTIKVGKKNKLDLPEIKNLLESMLPMDVFSIGDTIIIIIEEQRSMHKQGVTSTFSTGQGYGQLEGLCVGLGLTYHIIRPVDWQREMFHGLPKGNTKSHSKLIAQRLFPNIVFKKSARCTNLHDGMTDAILIAEYARRKL